MPSQRQADNDESQSSSPSADLSRTAASAESQSSETRLEPVSGGLRARVWTGLAVAALLILHYALAARSLMLENPTVDEVVHMPAGITYWQKGTFRLYHHNPPLFKLVAALPVVLAQPETEPLYALKSWKSNDPSAISFSQWFTSLNYARYFELFQLARLPMPLFSIVGGLFVFAWSRRLYGTWGGLLSLSLWVFCPNILAHARLVTSDVSATAFGVGATYVFWRYLHKPTWRWAVAAGVALGLAQLTKFSMLLLFAVWPFLWLVRFGLAVPRSEWLRVLGRGLVQGVAIVALSIATIDAGYLFEGVAIPLGQFEFASSPLTRAVSPGVPRPRSQNPLVDAAWQFRINRFRGTWLGRIPAPLPEHYLLGFDEQKLEADGLPTRFNKAVRDDRQAIANQQPATHVEHARRVPESRDEKNDAYTVYLNGEIRGTGWWYYYLLTLVYKVPEGTWLLVILSLFVLAMERRSRAAWADEIALGTVPMVILFSMSFLTDINLGLRYVLPIAPYVFVAVGKVVPWSLRLVRPWRFAMGSLVAGSLGLTIAASTWIHPDYLAYFNWASGGPDRDPARLIDSNLDWGQDLVGLQRWWRETIPGQPIGLAYFGQINPSIFAMRGESFRWFLPPAGKGEILSMNQPSSPRLIGPAPRLTPGYYAVSATLLYGLPWRLYDPAPLDSVPEAWPIVWNAYQIDAYGYFREFTPINRIGHSINIYRLTEEDIARVAPSLKGSAR